VQRLLKHALSIGVEALRSFFYYFFQLSFRFFANASHYFAHAHIQLLLQLLGRCFERLLLVSFLFGPVSCQFFGSVAASFIGLALQFFLGRAFGRGYRSYFCRSIFFGHECECVGEEIEVKGCPIGYANYLAGKRYS